MFCFLLFARARGPRPNSKKKAPAQTAKNKHAPDPSERLFCCLGGKSCSCFCCLGGGRDFCFAVWAVCVCVCVCVFYFAVWAGACLFFAVWAGLVFFLLFGRGRHVCFYCLGGGRVFCFAVWAGDGSSLTYRSAWLVFQGPNNKKDQQQKKHGFHLNT